MSKNSKSNKSANSDKDVLIVSQQGYNEMTEELDYRIKVLRPQIADEIKQARDLGDLSENHPYTQAMQKKEMNDARIDELEYLISIAQISSASDADDVVTIGHTVEIQKVGGEKKSVVLVGKSETQQANPAEGKVSIDSPLGKAINMAKVGDTVVVSLPKGEAKYKILRIAA
ncbi:MAG: transcription elongation factor GreA [Candidatus Doudnabacteria bacterium]|nr:transcription elongation factor GreA [Candidatus Doudnabacteria bacterium]